MRKLLLATGLFISLISSAQVTIQNSGSRIRYVNGVYVGTKQDAQFSAADSGAIYAKNDSTLMFKYKGTARALMYAANVGAQIHDSLYAVYQLKAGTSAGARLVSNSGTVISEWGLGGSANMDFHGFAGYDANRSSSYTDRSFTDKGYVDSSRALDIPLTQKGSNNGVASLDAGGKVPISQLPSSLMIYKGTWDASTNTPTLNNTIGIAGWVYQISNYGIGSYFGTLDTFYVGDYIMYSGTSWEVSSSTETVRSVSVNGSTPQQGVVSITLPNSSVTNTMLAGSIDYAKMNAATVPTWNQNTTGTAYNITRYTINQNLGTTNNITHATITATNALYTTANLGGYSLITKGRASDNYAISGFYDNAGATRYGYIQSHSAYGGTLAIVGDGGGRIDIDNRGVTVTGGNIIGNLTGNAATATLAANSTLWNGYANDFATTISNPVSVSSVVIKHTNGTYYPATNTAIQGFLCLGSNAYTSTAYLPLSAGASFPLTGDLTISKAIPILTIKTSDANQFHGIEFIGGTTLDATIKQLPQTGEFRIANGRSSSWGGFTTFYTDLSERMRITATGNVGINNLGTNAKLEVQASSGEVFRADAASGAYRIIAEQTGVLIGGTLGVSGALTGTSASFSGALSALGGTFTAPVYAYTANNSYALSMGGSGGDYGSVGYNVGYTTTSNSYTYKSTDAASFIRFTNGTFQFISAASGSAGAAMTTNNHSSISSTGVFTGTGATLSGALLATSGSFSSNVSMLALTATTGYFSSTAASSSSSTGAVVIAGGLGVGGIISGESQINAGTALYSSGTLGAAGVVTLANLAGTGDRMVVANASGVLSTQAIPSGGGIDGTYSPTLTGVTNITSISAATGIYIKVDSTWHISIPISVTPSAVGTCQFTISIPSTMSAAFQRGYGVVIGGSGEIGVIEYNSTTSVLCRFTSVFSGVPTTLRIVFDYSEN